MKWTTQRKVSVGVLALAAGAFAVDQFVPWGGAEEPPVAAAVAAARPAGAGPVVVKPVADGAQPMAVLARHLQRVAADEGLAAGRCADGFRPPAAWYPKPAAPASQPAVAAAELPKVKSRAPDFKAAYRLTAVLRTGPRPEQGMAVLHGAKAGQRGVTVRVGQELGGFVLRAVHDRSITLSDGREQFELELPDPGLATSPLDPA